MRLLVALSLLLAGCASYAAGPQVVYSKDLGSHRPAFGLVAEGESEWGSQEIRVLSIDKGSGGDGVAVASRTIFGSNRAMFGYGIGADVIHVSVDKWQKTSASFILQGKILARHTSYALTIGGPDRDKVSGFVSLRIAGRGRWRPVFDLEQVFYEGKTGQRLAVAVVRSWR